MTRRAALALLLVLSACSFGGAAGGDDSPDRGALLDVWGGLDAAVAGLAGREPEVCDPVFATWFTWGTRGLACSAAQVVSPTAFVDRAPVAPFRSGPHTATVSGVDLDLNAPAGFGHWDPQFVRWLTEAAIPEGAAARAIAQPVYNRRVRRLARVFWLTHGDLTRKGFPDATPAGPLSEYTRYLEAGAEPGASGFSVFDFTDLSDRQLPKLALPASVNEWEPRYELNTAYGFWLRRRADGTHDEWLDGLRQLLTAFDADWLAEHGG